MPTDAQIVFILSICCFLIAIIRFPRHLFARAFVFRVVSLFFLVLPFLSALAFACAQSPEFPLVDFSRRFLKLLFSVLIGLLTAIFSVRLLFLRYTNGQVAVPFGWILLILVFFAFGMLHQELPSLLRRTHEANINATGIHLVLEKQDRAPRKGLILDSRLRDKQEYSQETSYLFGAEGLRNLVDKGMQDTKNIIQWCHNDRPANNVCEHKPTDLEALYMTNLYLKTLKPIAECLADYGKVFPNGLPIQDELSELAVQMSRYQWGPSNARPDNKDIDTGVEKNLKEISDRIRTVPAGQVSTFCKTPFEERFRPKEGQNGDEKHENCTNIARAAREGLDSDDQTTAYGLADIRACWQKYKKTPHRALMEGYLIAAAGYPHDAARQLERFFEKHCEGYKVAKIPMALLEDGCQDRHGWDKWLNNIRYLGELEKFYAFAREYDLQFDTIRNLRAVLDDMLKSIMDLDGTHTASATTNVVHYIGHLLTWCAGRKKGKTMDYESWDDYIPLYVYYRIVEENRLWDIDVKDPLVSVEEMSYGRKALKFVFDNRDVYDGCVRAKVMPAARASDEIEETRIAAGHNAAQVQTREIIKREEKRKAVGGVAYEEYREELCSAWELLVLVYEQAEYQERADDGDKDREWRDRETKRARLLLEAIEGANVGPCR